MQGAIAHSQARHADPVTSASIPGSFRPERVCRRAGPPIVGKNELDAVEEGKNGSRATWFIWIIRGLLAALLILALTWVWTVVSFDDPQPIRPSLTVFLLPVLLLLLVVIAAFFERSLKGGAAMSPGQTAADAAFALEAANLGLWTWMASDNKVHANARCRAMLGLQLALPCDLSIFLHRVLASGRVRLRIAIETAIATGGHFEMEVRVVSAGQTRWLLANGQTRYDPRLNATGFAGFFLDVTERKEAERDAAAQRKIVAHLARVDVLGGLSGAIAHELNQPLAAALCNAQAAQILLSKKPPNMIEIGRAIDDIVAENGRAGEIIHHFRDLLKRSEVNFKPVDLNEIVALSLNLVRLKLHQPHTRTILKLAPGVLLVKGDSIQLEQVLLNLIMNASESMAAHNNRDRALTIATTGQGGTVEAVVLDNGPGISPQILPRLFEPFCSTKNRGLGLGLSISRSIAVAHGGELRGGNAFGGGAEFRLTLPALGME